MYSNFLKPAPTAEQTNR